MAWLYKYLSRQIDLILLVPFTARSYRISCDPFQCAPYFQMNNHLSIQMSNSLNKKKKEFVLRLNRKKVFSFYINFFYRAETKNINNLFFLKKKKCTDWPLSFFFLLWYFLIVLGFLLRRTLTDNVMFWHEILFFFRTKRITKHFWGLLYLHCIFLLFFF